MLLSFLWPTQTIDDLHLLLLHPLCAYDVHALLFSHQARVDATVSLSFVSPSSFTAANSKTSVSNECSLGFPRRRAGLELRTVSLLQRCSDIEEAIELSRASPPTSLVSPLNASLGLRTWLIFWMRGAPSSVWFASINIWIIHHKHSPPNAIVSTRPKAIFVL